MSLHEFKMFFDNNIEPWGSFNFSPLPQNLLKGFAYGNSFTLRRIISQFSFIPPIFAAILHGNISVNPDNYKSLDLKVILKPFLYLHLVLIGIIGLDFINFFLYLFSFLSPQFRFIPVSLETFSLQRESFFTLNIFLVLNYLWFRFEFIKTQTTFQKVFSKSKCVN